MEIKIRGTKVRGEGVSGGEREYREGRERRGGSR